MPPPSRSERNAIRSPDGENAGCVSSAEESDVKLTVFLPPTRRTKISQLPCAGLAYATVRPSGERLGQSSKPGWLVTCVSSIFGKGATPPSLARRIDNAYRPVTIIKTVPAISAGFRQENAGLSGISFTA